MKYYETNQTKKTVLCLYLDPQVGVFIAGFYT